MAPSRRSAARPVHVGRRRRPGPPSWIGCRNRRGPSTARLAKAPPRRSQPPGGRSKNGAARRTAPFAIGVRRRRPPNHFAAPPLAAGAAFLAAGAAFLAEGVASSDAFLPAFIINSTVSI